MVTRSGRGSGARPTIAIVGCGRIARVHAKNLAAGARFVFVSRRRESAEAFRERFGGDAAADLGEVAEREDIAGAVVCSPLDCHAEQTVTLLEAGKAVLVEKPMAATRAEVEAIGAAFSRNPGSRLMVAENYLYKPSLRRLRALLPGLGRIRRVRLRKETRQEARGWRTAHGALLEGGIHFVALLGAIVDEKPESVAAVFPGAARPERRAALRIGYPSGVRGEVCYAWDRASLPGGILQHSTVEGDRGRIVFESNGLYLARRGGGLFRVQFGPLSDLMGFGAMTRDFLRLVASPEHCPVSGFERARRDLGVVFRALESGAAG